MTAGLYIHIPFCEIRCGYCDFFTAANQEEQIPAYLQAICREIDLYSGTQEWQQQQFSTLYFGGGTPSLLTPTQIYDVITHAQKRFSFVSDSEITLEANPNTVNTAKLAACRHAGVNRLSLGVQSIHENELKFLDRDHTAKQSVSAFTAAQAAGFDNISLDLIYSLPKQQLQQWRQTLTHVVELAPQHISAYSLTYEEGTPLSTQLRKGRFAPASDERQRTLQLAAIDILGEHGLEQYEISNYAKPGYRSRHNQKYWDGSPYLGLGASSHSYLDNRRFWNVRNTAAYISALNQERLPVHGSEILTQDENEFESVYLGLRQSRGLQLTAFEQKTGVPFFQRYSSTLEKFFPPNIKQEQFQKELLGGSKSLNADLMQICDGYLRLTREGIMLCDAICSEFV